MFYTISVLKVDPDINTCGLSGECRKFSLNQSEFRRGKSSYKDLFKAHHRYITVNHLVKTINVQADLHADLNLC